MKAFELYDATTVEEAVALLDKYGPTSKIVAGGSDLVTGVMKDWVQGPGMPYPEVLIDINTIPELHGIAAADSGLRVGSATTLTQMFESEEINAGWRILSESAFSVASP
jgi:CO/xanthine dehydrogenase FAD-binding subunit